MSQLVKKNSALFPSIVSDFFDTNRLFPSLFGDAGLSDFNGGSLTIPNANITESEKDYKIEVAAPGLEKKDFKVEVDNGILTVSSEKEKEETEERKNYKRREFSYQSFTRSFALPDNSVPDKIDAKYDNGILTLSVPKKEVTVSKPVKEIKVA